MEKCKAQVGVDSLATGCAWAGAVSERAASQTTQAKHRCTSATATATAERRRRSECGKQQLWRDAECRTHPSRGTPWQGHGADETPGLVTGPRPRRASDRGVALPDQRPLVGLRHFSATGWPPCSRVEQNFV